MWRLLLAIVAATPSLGSPAERAAECIHMHEKGWPTAAAAGALGCTQRRVQQILSAAGCFAAALPVHPDFDAVVMYEAERHGPNYGYKMLLGALRHHHPGWAWARRPVYEVLHRLDPEAYEARRHWALRRAPQLRAPP